MPQKNKSSSPHTYEISSSRIDPEICSHCYETIPSDSPRETIDKQTVCLKCFELYTKRQLSLKTQNNDRKNNGPRLAFYVLGTLVIFFVSFLVWVFVIHTDFGIFNYLLRLVGLEAVNWLGKTSTALPTIVSLEVWRASGFWALYFLASLLAIPTELYQAAKIDGAGSIRRFWYLTLPLLRPTFIFALIMITIWHFQLFDSVYVLTDGGPNYSTATIVWYIYKNTFQFNHPAYGATMSFFLLIITLTLALVELRLLKERKRY